MIMKRVLIYILAAFFVKWSYAQVDLGCYGIDRVSDGMSCDLCIHKNGQYYLTMSEMISDDLEDVVLLSYGNYLVDADTLLLLDTNHAYTMKLLKKGTGFIVVSALCFLNNRFMSYWGEYDIAPPLPTISSAFIDYDMVEYNDRCERLFQVSIGNYVCEQGYELSLSAQSTYIIRYKGCALSKGQWKREGNILNLYDTSLDCTFHLLIGDGVLVSRFLPGDNTGGLVLKRKSANTPVSRPSTRGFGCSRNRNNQ